MFGSQQQATYAMVIIFLTWSLMIRSGLRADIVASVASRVSTSNSISELPNDAIPVQLLAPLVVLT